MDVINTDGVSSIYINQGKINVLLIWYNFEFATQGTRNQT